jgi:DNA polymerase II large subunit
MRFHIEKNTVELRQKLENMGFEKNPFMSHEEYINENLFLVVCSDNGYNTIVTAHPNSKIILPEHSISCGVDEDMFFGKINKFINFVK